MKTLRTEINQALAKTLAYTECGKFDEAERWGAILIKRLEIAGVFQDGQVTFHHGLKSREKSTNHLDNRV